MLKIDGAAGEGGGQVLRTSLALSALTGKPFEIESIRARRRKPGLMRQHLTAVRAAAAVCGARLEGDAVGSGRLRFEPGPVTAGDYSLAVGTAGSATLVLETILPPLLLAEGPSRVRVEGGTHNPMAPPFDFLQRSFLPLLGSMGARVSARLERWGFYPAGGGVLSVEIEPAGRLAPLRLEERGEIRARSARAVVANLPRSIGERELARVREGLGLEPSVLEVEEVSDSPGPGNAVSVELAMDSHREVFTSFGEKGVPARAVADDVVRQARSYLAEGQPVGIHLADQLMIPLALAGEGRYRTGPPSRHSLTNAEIVNAFLGDHRLTLREVERRAWVVEAGLGRV